MPLLCAISSDDGKNLRLKGHFGDAPFYLIYLISGESAQLKETRKNPGLEETSFSRHGDPLKAASVDTLLEGIHVLASREFGPNIKRMLKKRACVILKSDSLPSALSSLRKNHDRIKEEYLKENRKPLIAD